MSLQRKILEAEPEEAEQRLCGHGPRQSHKWLEHYGFHRRASCSLFPQGPHRDVSPLILECPLTGYFANTTTLGLRNMAQSEISNTHQPAGPPWLPRFTHIPPTVLSSAGHSYISVPKSKVTQLPAASVGSNITALGETWQSLDLSGVERPVNMPSPHFSLRT